MSLTKQKNSSLSQDTSKTSLSEIERLVFNKALSLLSRREHSRKEIQKKLFNKFPEANAAIEDTLNNLEEQNYLCETRFKFMLAKSLINKYSSNTYITHKLKTHSITMQNDEINLIRDELNISEDSAVRKLLEKKLSLNIGKQEQKRRETAIRFAMTKGFSYQAINLALNYITKDDF